MIAKYGLDDSGAKRMKYEVIIYWSDEDKAFIAEVPELPGCAADGRTKSQALAAIERVAAEWIETAKSLGRPISGPARPIDVCVMDVAPRFLPVTVHFGRRQLAP